MQITTQIKLLPSKEQAIMLESTMQEYISTANNIVNDYVVGDKGTKHTSKSIIANLPSALKNQAIFQFSENQYPYGIIKTTLSNLAICHFLCGSMVSQLES